MADGDISVTMTLPLSTGIQETQETAGTRDVGTAGTAPAGTRGTAER